MELDAQSAGFNYISDRNRFKKQVNVVLVCMNPKRRSCNDVELKHFFQFWEGKNDLRLRILTEEDIDQ